MSIYHYDRRPFLYAVGWTELNAWYLGIKWAKGCGPLDLWTTYFTSSRLVAELRETFGEPDHIEILAEGTSEHIVELETFLLKGFQLHRHDRWLNRSAGGKEFVKGPASEETRARHSASAKANPGHQAAMASGEVRGKISKTMKARFNDPVVRAARAAQTKAYWADPAKKAARLEANAAKKRAALSSGPAPDS